SRQRAPRCAPRPSTGACSRGRSAGPMERASEGRTGVQPTPNGSVVAARLRGKDPIAATRLGARLEESDPEEGPMAIDTTTGGAGASPRLDSRLGSVRVGVDSTAESVEAARQAGILATDDAKLSLLSVWTLPPPAFLGIGAPERAYPEEDSLRRRTAEAALAE